jgi:hypothetical protein
MGDTLTRELFDLGGAIQANLPKTELPPEVVSHYLAHKDQIVEAIKRGFVLPDQRQKFALFVDLGIITVPDDYVHATRLARFMERNRKRFYGINDDITDANFSNPSRILKPGDKLRVRAFQQIVGGTTTSEERLAFLATQKAIHTGAQGASLVFEQKRDQLPKGKWYASFDEKERLWEDADGGRWVPYVIADEDGDWYCFLGSFEKVWDRLCVFLCFCDLESA